MQLTQKELQDWIERLRRDPEASVTAQPSGLPFDSVKRPATWRLGVYASAYFHLETPEARARRMHFAARIPALHARFQAMTDHALTRYQPTGSSHVSKQYTQVKLEEDFLNRAENLGIAALNGFSEGSKESSPHFALEAIADFTPYVRRPDWQPVFSHFSARVPLSFWRERRTDFMRWWFEALDALSPEQAYLGLAIANPPILERYPLIETAEYALAEAFLGLDIDKPFFMVSPERDGLHLESGLRTPSFGVLLTGETLARLGGKEAVFEHAARSSHLRLTPCLDGWWIEADREPALFPVAEGVPEAQADLAALTAPVRLDALRLVSYNPNMIDPARFTPATARRWLKRFDPGSDWPTPEARQPAQAPAPPPAAPVPSARPGEPCPRDGLWFAIHLRGKTIRMQAGDPMPGPEFGPSGAVTWYFKEPG